MCQLFGSRVIPPFVPEGDSAHSSYSASAVFVPAKGVECGGLFGRSLPVELLRQQNLASSACHFCINGQPFTQRMVEIPGHGFSGTSRTINSLAENPITPASAGKLLSPL